MSNHPDKHTCCHRIPQTTDEPSQKHIATTLTNAHWDSFLIEAMDCPTEERLIREKFNTINEIKQLKFNLIKRTLKVQHCYSNAKPIQQMIHTLGMEAILDTPETNTPTTESTEISWRLIAATLLACITELLHFLEKSSLLTAILALITILLIGIPTYRKGLVALKNKTLNINALMSIAVTGAILIGQWPEAAMVITLFSLAETLEAYSINKARKAIDSLLALSPPLAEVQQPDQTWQTIPIEQISLQTLIRVKAGQRIPLDGIITKGQSSIDQSTITGESMPVEKTIGDDVFAGTINGTQTLYITVTHLANDTTLARIIQQVEEAQSSRAPMQRFVDKFASYYTPSAVIFALIIALITVPDWLYTGQFTIDWIYKALVILVIACPCALVISTPMTFVTAMARAARLGILIKGGVYLELGARLQWLALDKTGTLTEGKPTQTDFINLHTQPEAQQWATSLASHSTHPVSQAITNAASLPLLQVEDFQAIVGKGSKGNINQHTYFLGNYRLITELGLADEAITTTLHSLEQQGKTVTLLADSKQIIAIIAVADRLKDTAQQAIQKLHQQKINVLMLTGDNTYTANTIAKQVGIDQIKAQLLPQDKLTAIEEKIAQGYTIAMVGDGINDTPALARADIGFAMGAAGTDSAIETADVALMDDDLQKLPLFIRLAKATRRILIQNISFAIVSKLIFLLITLIGLGSLWLAIFADIGITLLVIINSLRLLHFK